MKTLPTATAMDIFDSIQRGRTNSVFLCEGEDGPKLSFGRNRTSLVEYHISLRSAYNDILLESNQPRQFALLLDDEGANNALRLVLYLSEADAPVLEYDGLDNDRDFTGQILILAHSERGSDQAVIHAAFAGAKKSSLIVDSSPQLCRHLIIATHVWGKEEKYGGANEAIAFAPLS